MHYCAKVLIFLRKAARRRSQFAEEISRKEMEGGNGASAVTLCSNHTYQSDAVENLPGSRTKSAAARRRSQSALPRVCQYPLPLVALLLRPPKKISRKVREVRKFINWRPLAAEASENLLNVESPSALLVRGRLRPLQNRSRSWAAEDCREPAPRCAIANTPHPFGSFENVNCRQNLC